MLLKVLNSISHEYSNTVIRNVRTEPDTSYGYKTRKTWKHCITLLSTFHSNRHQVTLPAHFDHTCEPMCRK